MSNERVEVARRAYEAFNSGGVEAILEFLDPEIEWRMWEQFSSEPRVFHGHDGVREVLSLFEENYDDFCAEPSEYIEADEAVIVQVQLRGKAKGTRDEAAFDLVHVWSGPTPRPVRLDVYTSIDEALEATGRLGSE
jgi:ketosteroid isomerase-like protein